MKQAIVTILMLISLIPMPMTASANEDAPTIEVEEDKQRMVGIRTVLVERKPVKKVIRTVGRIENDERNVVSITTKYPAWIEKLQVNYTGKAVKKGEVLAELYSPELFSTQQELINALRWRDDAKKAAKKGQKIDKMLAKDAETVLKAARERLRLWDISKAQIAQIEKTRKPIRTLSLKSPSNGIVQKKTVVQGDQVKAGEKLFEIVDLDNVWVWAEVYESDVPFVHVGQKAGISVVSMPGKQFTSKVEFISPVLEQATRTVRMRFSIPNPKGELRPQMYADVELHAELGKRLAVPSEAVINTGKFSLVYVDTGDGYFEPRKVKTGISADGLIEVLANLNEGDRIAATANFLLDSEAKLKGVLPQ